MPPNAVASRARRGVTLIEMIVVMLMIGVAAGLVVPRMGRSLARQQVEDTAARLTQTARTVREVAISTQRTWMLNVDRDHGGYGVARESSEPGEASRPIEASWLKTVQWPQGVKLAEWRRGDGSINTQGTDEIHFFPDGTSDGAVMRFESDGHTAFVAILPYNGHAAWAREMDPAWSSWDVDLGD